MRIIPLVLLLGVSTLWACKHEAPPPDQRGQMPPPDQQGEMPPPDLNSCPAYNTSGGPPNPEGTPCSPPGLACYYFEAACICRDAWRCCWSGVPGDCPLREPRHGDGCGGPCRTNPCTYACSADVQNTCTCTLGVWSCVARPCSPDGGARDGT